MNSHKIGVGVLVILCLVVGVSQTQAQPVMLVKDIRPGPVRTITSFITDVNGTAFFSIWEELWKSDGTVNGTVLVKLFSEKGVVRDLTNVNGVLLFSAFDDSSGAELWKSDGTTAGTVLVKDIWPGVSSGLNTGVSNHFINVNGTLFFVAEDGTTGEELWKSDATTAGTALVKDINPFGTSNPARMVNVNGTLFFSASDGTILAELWKSDGTAAGTVLVKDINPGFPTSNPAPGVHLNGILLLAADDGVTGSELWKSDGTTAGTVLVKDINPSGSSFPGLMVKINDTVLINADDGTNGRELWKSDGTAAGTVLVKDINSGASSSGPGDMTVVNGTLFFSADDGVNGRELWKSDGTTAGTVLVKDIRPGANGSLSSTNNFTNVNGELFFTADDGTTGVELWKSDGTTEGTVLVKDIYPLGNSDPVELENINGTLFFNAFEEIHARELRAVQSPVTVTLTPSNPPIQIPPAGGSFQFDITLENISGESQNKQVWNMITLPNGGTVGPTIGPVSPTIASGESVSRTLTQEVPGSASAGQYTYTLNVGLFPDTIDASDSFTFTKVSPTSGLQASASREFNTWKVLGAPNERGSVTAESEQGGLLPEEFVLEQNYPNPFNPSTVIRYVLNQDTRVNLKIYNMLGQEVVTLVNEFQSTGAKSVFWDSRDSSGQPVSAGIYLYKIEAGDVVEINKMVLIK